MQRRAFLAAAAGGSVGLAGCIDAFGSESPEYDVGMRASAFIPTELDVTVGETVIWYNNNDRAHTVTAYETALPADGMYFASGGYADESTAREAYERDLGGAIYAGERYEHTFETAGEFPYFCVPHERQGMTGTIVVRA